MFDGRSILHPTVGVIRFGTYASARAYPAVIRAAAQGELTLPIDDVADVSPLRARSPLHWRQGPTYTPPTD